MANQLRPTVILQDLVMPDMDGLKLVQYYQHLDATKNVPILVLSSREDGESKALAFETGANDYLVKLPNTIELLARLRYHNQTSIERMELHVALKELERISTTDALTNIANRRYFDDLLEKQWRLAMRNRTPISLALIDIDFFKQYNDHYGHQLGDACLTQVAHTLREIPKRPTDLIARYGGEEFVALLPDTPMDGAKKVSEALRQAIEQSNIEHHYSNIEKHLTISIGIATNIAPAATQHIESLLRIADENLYIAKKSGRNRVHSSLMEEESPA